MLQTKYKTNSLMRCKNLGFAIPLGSILVLLVLLVAFVWLPFDNSSNGSNMAYAVDDSNLLNTNTYSNGSDADIMPLADSPSVSLSYSGSSELSGSGAVSDGENSAIVSMSSDITINATLINSYNLQIASGASTTESNNPTYLEGPTTIIPIDNVSNPNGISSVEGLADNTWGYSWNNGSYKGITNSNVSIESANVGNTNNGTVSFTKPLTFVAKFNKDANAGHYRTKVNLLLTATPKTLISLTYNANGGSNTPNQSTCASYTSCRLNLSVAKPTRDNFAFIGWDTNSSAQNVLYRPGESIAITENTTLYAVWKQLGIWEYNNGTTANAGITTMQSMTGSICNQMSTPAVNATDSMVPKIYLKDMRDSNTYTIRKLQDGRCWMTDNLHLSAPAGGRLLTPNDSNISANWTMPETLTDENLGSPTNDECSRNFNEGSGSGVVTSCLYKAQSYIATHSAYTPEGGAYTYTGETGYYSWFAATAGSGDSSLQNGDNATASICPKGWKLPTGGSSSNADFYNLAKYMGLTIGNNPPAYVEDLSTNDLSKVNSVPYNFNYTGYYTSGYWQSGPPNQSGSREGDLWSSTFAGGNSVNQFHITNYGRFYPGTQYNRIGRWCGVAMRCIAEETTKVALTFDPGDDSTYTLRDNSLDLFNSKFPTQTASVNSDTASYSFTIPTESSTTYYSRYYSASSFGQYYIKGWTTTKGSSTVQYAFGATVTVNASSPNLTLYPVWQGITGGGSLS